MPQLEIIHLPSDHTSGGKAGTARHPRALHGGQTISALGRMIEALSQTPFLAQHRRLRRRG